jgi:nitrogen fixation/metabolism regulation signal transduction histidine kinase
MRKKVPFHKMKWYVGSRVQKDLFAYIICMSILSQMIVVSYLFVDAGLIDESYAQFLLPVIYVTFLGYVLYGFWLSNRIAGPLFRFKTHMDKVAEGKIDDEIQFRKNDYGLEIAESFNAVVRNRIRKSGSS